MNEYRLPYGTYKLFHWLDISGVVRVAVRKLSGFRAQGWFLLGMWWVNIGLSFHFWEASNENPT